VLQLRLEMSLKVVFIKYTVALITGFLFAISLAIGFVCKRSEFKVKKRNAPKFLTDSSLWKHGYLTLKVSKHKQIFTEEFYDH
jgi:hypothetical protein